MDMFIGSICAFSFDFAPKGWFPCQGQAVTKGPGTIDLFNVIGYQYGGQGNTFYLPDLRGRAVIERGQASPQSTNFELGTAGGSESVTLNPATMGNHNHNLAYSFGASSTRTDVNSPVNAYPSKQLDSVLIYNGRPSNHYLANPTITIDPVSGGNKPMDIRRPYLVANYCICVEGIFPTPNPPEQMMQPLLGTIEAFAFNAIPGGYRECNGQTLDAGTYHHLYTIIGTTYGGDDTHFALPDLRGREVVSMGQGPGLKNYYMGENGGNETVSLSGANMPPHTHNVKGTMPSATAAETGAPDQKYPAVSDSATGAVYKLTKDGAMAPGNAASSSAGSSAPINLLNPYVVLVYCIFVGDPQ